MRYCSYSLNPLFGRPARIALEKIMHPTTLRISACVLIENQFSSRAASRAESEGGPKRAAEAVEAVRSGRMTFRAAAKTSWLVRCRSLSVVAQVYMTVLAQVQSVLSSSDEK